MTGETRYVRRGDVATEWLDGEALLWDDDAGELHRLAPVAAAVWAACDAPRTPDELTERVGADPVVARAVDDLLRLHLLQCRRQRAIPRPC
jgi:hypothetical protein